MYGRINEQQKGEREKNNRTITLSMYEYIPLARRAKKSAQ